MNCNNRSDVVARLCSSLSNDVGEDPIGSSPTWDHCLFIEVSTPWMPEVALSENFPAGVSESLKIATETGTNVRLQVFQPDPEYTKENHRRILFYSRPYDLFSKYNKLEFVAPDDQIGDLVQSILCSRDNLYKFDMYLQDTHQIRDLFVCTHGSRDVCCGSLGYPIFEILKNRYACEVDASLRVWRTSHTGGHRLAPNIIDMPEGRYWCRIGPDSLETLINRDLSPSVIRSHYRGWAGIKTPVEQVAEREILIREGWEWTGFLKNSRVISETNDKTNVVQIDFMNPGTDRLVSYQAIVCVQGSVIKANCMMPSIGAETIPQYTVSNLSKII